MDAKMGRTGEARVAKPGTEVVIVDETEKVVKEI